MNTAAVRILLVEDSPSDAALLQESLRDSGYGRFEFTHVESLAEGLDCLRRHSFDVLLLDLSLPDSTGPDTFLRARNTAPQVPIVVLTGLEDETVGLEAVRHGIQDYLVKGQSSGRHIARSIRYAIERKQTEEALKFLMQCGTTGSGEGFFEELARYLARTLNMDFVCIDRLEAGSLAARTLAVFHNGRFEDNISYTLKDTPCGDVVGQRICCFPRNVRGLFPKDAVLQDLQAESYVGTTLWNSQGQPIGLIALIGRQPLADTGLAESILLLVAVRAAGELERQQAEEALRKLNEELEQRVAERTAEVRAASLYARNLIETSLDPLVTISRDGKITDVNHATELATGVPRERLIGSNFSDYFTEPDKANAGYQKVIAEGLVRDYPLTIRHAAGHTMHVLYNAAVYRNEAGEVQGVFAAARDITERKRMEDAHSDLQRRLVVAEETERGRISRELHDRLGQDLTALKLGLQLVKKQGPFTPSVQASIGQLEKLADSLMQDIHRLAWELRPAALDDFGLDMALRRYASEWSEHNGVAVDFHSQGVEMHRLPTELETTLYRITQEALTNVLRHAKAKRVGVILERRSDHVLLIVEDDGQGFDAQAALKAPGAHDRLGLLGMQERVILANGTIEIESTPGAGTTVFVRIPLESKISAVN